jgi:SAM-dependent methyltransferase
MEKTLPTITEKSFSELISKDVNFRLIEPHIYSVLPDIEVDSSYEKKFGDIYDWVACNPIYNRLVWGYSTSKFASFTLDALRSSNKGFILDAGCGSLAFTAKTYIQYSERPVVLIDQSLKLLRIAKSRITKLNGKVPDNMVFIHGDALQLPFESNTFHTIISLNLLHVLDDINKLLVGLRNVLVDDGKIYFTTLVKGNRMADRYLKMWENAGEVVSRDINQLQAAFDQIGMPIKYDINGNMAFIYYEGINNQQAVGME